MNGPRHVPDVGVVSEHALRDAHGLGLPFGQRIVVTDQPVGTRERRDQLGNLLPRLPDFLHGVPETDVFLVKRHGRQVDQIADVHHARHAVSVGHAFQKIDVAPAHARACVSPISRTRAKSSALQMLTSALAAVALLCREGADLPVIRTGERRPCSQCKPFREGLR